MRRLKAGILLFWALYFSIVTASNLADAFRTLGILGPAWTWSSGNYGFLKSLFSVLKIPGPVEASLFALIIGIEILASALFWRAWAQSLKQAPFPLREAQRAFAAALGLFAAFALAMEVIATDAAYSHEPFYFTVLIAQMAGLGLLHMGEKLEVRS